MHARVIAALHVGASFGFHDWALEPGVIASLAIAAALYARGVAVLWRDGNRRVVHQAQVASFGIGWLAVLIALASPLDALSNQLFTAHMIQHELLMVVAAPLLVLGRPSVVMLWAMPRTWRRSIMRVGASGLIRSVWMTMRRPFDAWLLHGVAIWIWHLPVLFTLALRSEAVHAAQHLSFVGSALFFWSAVIHPPGRAMRGMSVLFLFTTAVHTSVLGALMTFARAPWYPSYRHLDVPFGLTWLSDQQLAGMVMWIPASVTYLLAALFVARRWLSDSEWAVTRQDGATFAARPH